MHSLEVTDDPEGVLAQDVNRRLVQLAHEQDLKRSELRDLRSNPVPSSGRSTELLDYLGHVTSTQLEAAPEPALRRLFDATALTIYYDPRDRLAVCHVTLDEDNLPAINHATSAIATLSPDTTGLEICWASSLNSEGSVKDPQPDRLGIFGARSEELESPTF